MVLTLVLGGVCLLAGAFVATRKERLDVNARLDHLASALRRTDQENAIAEAKRTQKAKLITRIERLLLVKADHPWETRITPAYLILAGTMPAGTVWFVLFHVAKLPAIFAALASAAVLVLVPRLILIRERNRTRRAFTELLPDAIDTAIRILRAGLPITSAMRSIARDSPHPVNSVFATLSYQMEIGIPLEEALRLSSQQIGLADYRFFTVAVTLEQSAGGNLVSTLEVISRIMRKRRAVHQKAKAITAEIRFSAYVLSALPLVTVAALMVIQPNYLTPLVADQRGHIILGMAVCGLILCFLVMRRMMSSVVSL
jgi:tight adherence protein B